MNFAAAFIAFLFPRAPHWVGELVAALLPAVFDLVKTLTAKDIPGADKRKIVVALVTEQLDEKMDDVPEWKDLDEGARDRIIGGMAELALFVMRAKPSKGSHFAAKDFAKHLRHWGHGSAAVVDKVVAKVEAQRAKGEKRVEKNTPEIRTGKPELQPGMKADGTPLAEEPAKPKAVKKAAKKAAKKAPKAT